MSQKLIKFIATVAGFGYSRVAPGTAGTAGAAIIYLLVKDNFFAYAGVTAALIVLGFMTAGRAEALFGKKDASQIVIDEAAGLFVTLFLIPYSLGIFIVGFLLFRTLDVIKPFPIRRIERLPGSLGIMGDDIAAGILANLLLRLSLQFFFAQ